MPHMTTYGDQRDQKWTGSAIKPSVCLSRSGPEVSVCLSVRPKHFPYLLDEHYARELQAQGACALRFFKVKILGVFSGVAPRQKYAEVWSDL